MRSNEDALKDSIQNGYRVLVLHAYRKKNEIIANEFDDDEDEYDNIRGWLEDLCEKIETQKVVKKIYFYYLCRIELYCLEKMMIHAGYDY